MEGKTKERTMKEKRAYLDGYVDCLSNILKQLKDITDRETRATSTMVESLMEEINESENISGNV